MAPPAGDARRSGHSATRAAWTAGVGSLRCAQGARSSRPALKACHRCRRSGQALAALGAARLDHRTAAAGLHADEETVGTRAAGLGRLVGALHDEVLDGDGAVTWRRRLRKSPGRAGGQAQVEPATCPGAVGWMPTCLMCPRHAQGNGPATTTLDTAPVDSASPAPWRTGTCRGPPRRAGRASARPLPDRHIHVPPPAFFRIRGTLH